MYLIDSNVNHICGLDYIFIRDICVPYFEKANEHGSQKIVHIVFTLVIPFSLKDRSNRIGSDSSVFRPKSRWFQPWSVHYLTHDKTL